MKINKTQFRWLLAGYFFISLLTMIFCLVDSPSVPEIVKDLEPGIPQYPLPIMLFWLIFLITLLVVSIVSFIGIFRLSSRARYYYLGAFLTSIALHPLLDTWDVYTGWQSLSIELNSFLGGVIITLCIAGPAKELFTKKGIQPVK